MQRKEVQLLVFNWTDLASVKLHQLEMFKGGELNSYMMMTIVVMVIVRVMVMVITKMRMRMTTMRMRMKMTTIEEKNI